jgi:hypothetical protein
MASYGNGGFGGTGTASSGLGGTGTKAIDTGRSGNHGTIYKVRRDPNLNRSDVIKEKVVFPFVNGSSYKGSWKDNKKDGFGVEICSDGTKYEGEWRNDRRHGRGTLWVKSKKKYIKQYAGNWVDGKMEGQGVYSYEDGTIYKGMWMRNKRHNFGRLESPNGDVFTGEWVNDVRQGQGTYFHHNGNIYEGYWVDNLKEGPGKFYYAATNKVPFPASLPLLTPSPPPPQVYEGEWVEDSPQCGEFRDPNADEQSRFGKPLIRKSGFRLPEIMLANTRAVLDCTIAATRTSRGHHRGIESIQDMTHDSITTAESVFAEIDREGRGLVPFSDIFSVLQVLGVSLSEEEKEELLRVLEITPHTEVSFPEVVDIASFYGH